MNDYTYQKVLLKEKEEELHMNDAMLGISALSFPVRVSSARQAMFAKHSKQYVNLINPELPRVFTNYENTYGKFSTRKKKLKEDGQVYAIVPKYGEDRSKGYFMFLYHPNTDEYTVIERKVLEDLTEHYAFEYNNDFIDSLDVGDEVYEGDVLTKSNSYDEYMNYRAGINATFMYTSDPYTIEDAVEISRSLSERGLATDAETFSIPLNDNMILLNLFEDTTGDYEGYKAFPDIGETTKGSIVCSSRQIHNDRILHDLSDNALRHIEFGRDNTTFVQGQGTVIDINIYSNKPIDELPQTKYTKQIRKYLEVQQKFHERMYDVTKDIMKSGSKCSNEILKINKRAKNYFDKNTYWVTEHNKAFSNMIIEFTVMKREPIKKGQKIAGRFGNKGVVSRIVEDDEMPFLENGKRVDVLFNILGVINRLNSMQLFEQSITFISNRVLERANDESLDLTYRVNLIEDIITRFSPEEGEAINSYLNEVGRTEENLRMFIEEVNETKILIHAQPMWERVSLFTVLRDIYSSPMYDFIKLHDVFIRRFGRVIKMRKQFVIGEMYIYRLKQSSENNFSARSTGAISKIGLPERPAANKYDLYSKNPIRFGNQEYNNMEIGVPSSLIAKMHLMHRTSPQARKEISTELAEHGSIESKDITGYTNVSAVINNALFLCLGVGFKDDTEGMYSYIHPDVIQAQEYRGYTLVGNAEQIETGKLFTDAKEEIKERGFIGTSEAFLEEQKRVVEEIMKRREENK